MYHVKSVRIFNFHGLLKFIFHLDGHLIDTNDGDRNWSFYWKKGRHVCQRKNQYKIRINILTESSSMQLRRNLIQLMTNYGIHINGTTQGKKQLKNSN